MANRYEGTRTLENLKTAFAGESQARNKYTYFASVAKKEGFEQIAEIFQKILDFRRKLCYTIITEKIREERKIVNIISKEFLKKLLTPSRKCAIIYM